MVVLSTTIRYHRGMEPQISAERMEAWRAFLEAHAAVVDTLEQELDAERGLPLTWYDVLVQLSGAPEGRLRMRELAERVLLSRSGFTRLCDRMEAAGLIRRAACSEDRRGCYAALTPKGRRVFAKAAPVHARGIQEHFAGHLSDAEVEVLRRALDKVLKGNQLRPHGNGKR